MTLSLVQFRISGGRRGVGAIGADGQARLVPGAESVLQMAQDALASGGTLAQAASRAVEPLDLDQVELLSPVDHPDPAHLIMTGTGLTHLGSAESRDKMHRAAKDAAAPQTDSMRMFLMGLEGGRPAEGQVGVQPEWFYKGDGGQLVAPGQPIASPAFALDAGEEAEIAGVYLIGPDGSPVRLGFALANEFSDHVTERGNYLWLAHSKLRPAALGPELLLGELPADVGGTVRVLRDGAVLWEKPFLSGEANMSHAIANLEHHHFKYPLFRRPGDIHVHFFGAATLSFTDGVRTQPGDVFEIEARPFRLPARNPLSLAEAAEVTVKTL